MYMKNRHRGYDKRRYCSPNRWNLYARGVDGKDTNIRNQGKGEGSDTFVVSPQTTNVD
jgi:hypothetical protein